MARRNRLRMTVQENVLGKLTALQVSLRGPSVARALYEGARMIQAAAVANAPVDTGQLRSGVYVASMIANEFRPLVRSRTGQRLNTPLKSPPRPNQAIVISSVFYTRFVEGGVKGRMGVSKRTVSKRQWRGLGAQRKRPFFQRAKRQMRRPVEAHVRRRLVELIEGTWRA